MPLVRFYLNPGQLTAAEKAEIAQFLTKIYARVMPDFFVNVVFHEVRPALSHLSHGKTKTDKGEIEDRRGLLLHWRETFTWEICPCRFRTYRCELG